MGEEECKELASKAKFRLEFMALMLRTGRDKEATDSYNAVYELLMEITGEGPETFSPGGRRTGGRD